KGEHNVNFHPMVDFIEASPLSMQQTIPELTALCTSLQRQLSELIDKFKAQEVEFNRLKERVKLLEESEGLASKSSRDDAPIKGRSMDEGEGEGLGTPTEPHQKPSPKAPSPSHTTHTSPSLPPVTTSSIPTVTPTKTTPIRQYTRRVRIA
nr:hypothetical protein [Tanacetum cinerariifolium]